MRFVACPLWGRWFGDGILEHGSIREVLRLHNPRFQSVSECLGFFTGFAKNLHDALCSLLVVEHSYAKAPSAQRSLMSLVTMLSTRHGVFHLLYQCSLRLGSMLPELRDEPRVSSTFICQGNRHRHRPIDSYYYYRNQG